MYSIGADSSKEKERIKCLRSLFVTDPEDDRATYISFKGRAVTGTCTWLLQNQTFRAWRDPKSQSELLWLCGGPGTGKTMISIFLTEELEKLPSVVLLYYFCEGRNAKRNNAANILRGLIYLLLRQRPNLMEKVLPDFEAQDEALFSPDSIESMWRIFESMIRDPQTGPVFCVIDGMDECGQYSARGLEHVIKKIRSFYVHPHRMASSKGDDTHDATSRLKRLSLPSYIGNHRLPNESSKISENPTIDSTSFKMILVSREQPLCLLNELKDFPCVKLGRQSEDCSSFGESSVEAPAVVHNQSKQDSDAEGYIESLSIYITARVDELSKSKRYDDGLRSALKRSISQRANSTFLWVDMAIDQLENTDLTDTQSALAGISDHLEEVYCGMLLQVPAERASVVGFLIRWITTAFRPLSVLELYAALSISALLGHFECPSLQAVRDSIKACGNLLSTSDDEEVSLAHQTTKDFLISPNSPICADPRLHQYYVRMNETHAEIAYACFEYLNAGSLKEGPVHLVSGLSKFLFAETKWTPDEDRLKRYPLLAYAALNWPEHLRHGYPAQLNLESPFWARHSVLGRHWWVSVHEAITGSKRDSAPSFSPLLVAAFFDLKTVFEQLRQSGQLQSVINKKVWGVLNPLCIAVGRGSIDVFGFLLDNEADLNILGYHVLDCVCAKGTVALVKALLERGIDPNHITPEPKRMGGRLFSSHTPRFVNLACEATVDEEDKKDLGLASQDYGADTSPLNIAAMYGHDSVVEYLLERGANPRHSTTQGWTTLHFASSKGSTSAVDHLLRLGLPIDAVTARQQTPLHLASAQGHTSTVQLLLERGSCIEAKSLKGLTPLHLAAKKGHLPVVKLLLEHGPNRDAVSNAKETALKRARGASKSEVAKLLTGFQPPVARLYSASLSTPGSAPSYSPSISLYDPPPQNSLGQISPEHRSSVSPDVQASLPTASSGNLHQQLSAPQHQWQVLPHSHLQSVSPFALPSSPPRSPSPAPLLRRPPPPLPPRHVRIPSRSDMSSQNASSSAPPLMGPTPTEYPFSPMESPPLISVSRVPMRPSLPNSSSSPMVPFRQEQSPLPMPYAPYSPSLQPPLSNPASQYQPANHYFTSPQPQSPPSPSSNASLQGNSSYYSSPTASPYLPMVEHQQQAFQFNPPPQSQSAPTAKPYWAPPPFDPASQHQPANHYFTSPQPQSPHSPSSNASLQGNSSYHSSPMASPYLPMVGHQQQTSQFDPPPQSQSAPAPKPYWAPPRPPDYVLPPTAPVLKKERSWLNLKGLL
jgi:ankyrin repeat protein